MRDADGRRLSAKIHGRVQGVGFRYFVQRTAQRLGLKGWVRNLRSGAVEFVAEGPEDDVKELLEAAREGPPMAWVERVSVDWSDSRGLAGFEVKHTV